MFIFVINQIPFVMLRHNTPQALLDKFVEVFNNQFTRVVAKETYLSTVSGFRSRLLEYFNNEKYFNEKSQQFNSSLTAQLVKNALNQSMGSVSRCEICN